MKKLLAILVACLMPICLIAKSGDVNNKRQGIERLWNDTNTLIKKFLINGRLHLGNKNTQHSGKDSNRYFWISCAEITISKL